MVTHKLSCVGVLERNKNFKPPSPLTEYICTKQCIESKSKIDTTQITLNLTFVPK